MTMTHPTTEQKVARLKLVADGLRRIQEFESARYLDEYAATLKAAQGGVTEAMVEAMTEAWFAGYAMHRDSPIPEDAWSYGASRAEAEAFAHKYISTPPAQPADPTDPGNDVAVLREQVRHLERRVRELHAQPAERMPEGMVLIDREFIENADAALGLSTVDGEHWTEHESPRFELRMALGLPHEVPASPAAPADGDGKEVSRG